MRLVGIGQGIERHRATAAAARRQGGAADILRRNHTQSMPINLRAIFYMPVGRRSVGRRCLASSNRSVNGVNALKEQLSRICFQAQKRRKSTQIWRKSARSKAKRPGPSKTESNPYILAHTSPSISSPRLHRPLDADRGGWPHASPGAAVIFFLDYATGWHLQKGQKGLLQVLQVVALALF